MSNMKIGIIGSRKYEKKRTIKDFIFRIKEKYGENVTIVSGGCKDGADRYAKKYAIEFGLDYEEYPPAHQAHNLYCVLPENRYGKDYSVRHFFVRNKIIANVSDMVIAFIPEGIKSNGALDTIKQAKKQGKKVKIIY